MRFVFCAMAALIALPAFATTTFTTFSAGNSYNAAVGFDIGGGGPHSNAGASAAVPFLPLITGTLDDLIVGVANCDLGSACGTSSPNEIIVSLWDNAAVGGGNLIESIQVSGAMQNWVGGSTSTDVITALSSLHPNLVAGTQYWLVLTVPDPSTGYAIWGRSTNPTGLGTYTRIGAAAWSESDSNEAAFSVGATTTPEPSSLGLAAFGCGLLFLAKVRQAFPPVD